MGICGSKMVGTLEVFNPSKYWGFSYRNTWKNRSKLRSLSKSAIKELDNLELIKGIYNEPRQYKKLTDFIKKNPYSNLVVFGMGGSSLGTKAIFEALNYSKKVIDEKTILIFDEFLTNDNWEEDEYRALNEFCNNLGIDYDVLAVSFYSKQVAIKLKKIK